MNTDLCLQGSGPEGNPGSGPLFQPRLSIPTATIQHEREILISLPVAQQRKSACNDA